MIGTEDPVANSCIQQRLPAPDEFLELWQALRPQQWNLLSVQAAVIRNRKRYAGLVLCEPQARGVLSTWEKHGAAFDRLRDGKLGNLASLQQRLLGKICSLKKAWDLVPEPDPMVTSCYWPGSKDIKSIYFSALAFHRERVESERRMGVCGRKRIWEGDWGWLVDGEREKRERKRKITFSLLFRQKQCLKDF